MVKLYCKVLSERTILYNSENSRGGGTKIILILMFINVYYCFVIFCNVFVIFVVCHHASLFMLLLDKLEEKLKQKDKGSKGKAKSKNYKRKKKVFQVNLLQRLFFQRLFITALEYQSSLKYEFSDFPQIQINGNMMIYG